MLDEGWQLCYGYFLKTRAQAGVDYVFTYGPLGYLMVPLYFPGLFWLKYFWTASFALGSAYTHVGVMRRLPWRLLWLPYGLLVITVLPHSETQFILVLVASALLCAIDDCQSRTRVATMLAIFSTLALVKLTFFVLAVCCLAVLVAAGAKAQRVHRAAHLFGPFLVGVLVLWVAAGQSPAHLPTFVSRGLAMAAGYSSAMGMEGPRSYLVTSAYVLALFAGAGLIGITHDRGARRNLAGLALASGGLCFTWKEGFVRQGPHNAALFFGYSIFFPFLLLTLDEARRGWSHRLRLALLAMGALLGFHILLGIDPAPPRQRPTLDAARTRIVENVLALTSPRAYEHNRSEDWDRERQQWRLKAIQARVGRTPVDVVSVVQSVGFWNDVEWHSRPVFQGYAAYSKALAELNGEFFRRPDAPNFVVCMWGSIDGRFAASDDGRVLLELLHRYRPTLSERGFLLLERRSSGDISPLVGKVVLQRPARLGERIEVASPPGGFLTLTVDISNTFVGSFRRKFYWVPPPSISVELAGTTKIEKRDLVPGVAASEFMVSPFVDGNKDINLVYRGKGRSITAFWIDAEGAARACFADTVQVTVREYQKF